MGDITGEAQLNAYSRSNLRVTVDKLEDRVYRTSVRARASSGGSGSGSSGGGGNGGGGSTNKIYYTYQAAIAKEMASIAIQLPVSFIAALGDNFYNNGVLNIYIYIYIYNVSLFTTLFVKSSINIYIYILISFFSYVYE